MNKLENANFHMTMFYNGIGNLIVSTSGASLKGALANAKLLAR